MSYLPRNLNLLLAFLAATTVPAAAADETRDNLPAGQYLYLGSGGEHTPARALTIDSDGRVVWQEPKEGTGETKANTIQGTAPTMDAQPRLSQGEFRIDGQPVHKTEEPPRKAKKPDQDVSIGTPLDKPLKWNAKPIADTGAIAQLYTRVDYQQYQQMLKWRVLLYKLPATVQQLNVVLRDKYEFELAHFTVGRFQIHPISNTEFSEALGELPYTGKSYYQQVTDYTVDTTIQSPNRFSTFPFPSSQEMFER